MDSAQPRARRAFTLIEMLVVIAILGILSSLLLVGVNAARIAAKRGAILTELQQIDFAFKSLKTETDAYPPNLVHEQHGGSSQLHDRLEADLVRFFKKAFPRHQEQAVFDGLLGHNIQGPSFGATLGMSPAEAVVFWLGGFSEDVRFPISGKGGPAFDTTLYDRDPIEERNFKFEFDISRLGPRDANNNFSGRFIAYQHPVTGNMMRLNLWTYTPSKSKVPYIYYDTSRYKPSEYDPPYYFADDAGNLNGLVYPIKMLAAGVALADAQASDIVWANPKSFQILHCGVDDEWGNWGHETLGDLAPHGLSMPPAVVYPTGPFTTELADTLVNFSPTSLEDSEE